MFKADIHMRTHDMDERLGIECAMSVRGADLEDKMMLMHTLASGLEMSTTEILLYAIAEKEKVFNRNDTIEVRIPRQPKEDTNDA